MYLNKNVSLNLLLEKTQERLDKFEKKYNTYINIT